MSFIRERICSLGCRILVLINDDNDRVIPVEQLFLDINEKAQHLEVEDVGFNIV